MLMNDKQIRGIKDGIVEGFIIEGYELSDREKVIIDVTVKITLGVLEKAYENATKEGYSN